MSIMESINIGSNALKTHGLRLDIHAKNIANVDTPNYVRKIPVLNATEDISFHGLMNVMKNDVFGTGTLPYLQGGVTFNGCVEDPTVGERIYSPGHPDADANGYIRASNVNAMVEYFSPFISYERVPTTAFFSIGLTNSEFISIFGFKL